MVVNHWATWCESCETEKDALKDLARRISVPLVGISWDMFEGGAPADALTAVKTKCSDLGITWNQWVVKGKPPHFFKVLDVRTKQVPQTWIIDAQGQVVETIEGPIDSGKVEVILSRLESL
jgi:thiol-disulfide isomerase/thioredoxin